MRQGLYLSTALITTLHRDHVAAEGRDLPEFEAVLAWRPAGQASPIDSGLISAVSLCSDGEIFLEGELPYRVLLRD